MGALCCTNNHQRDNRGAENLSQEELLKQQRQLLRDRQVQLDIERKNEELRRVRYEQQQDFLRKQRQLQLDRQAELAKQRRNEIYIAKVRREEQELLKQQVQYNRQLEYDSVRNAKLELQAAIHAKPTESKISRKETQLMPYILNIDKTNDWLPMHYYATNVVKYKMLDTSTSEYTNLYRLFKNTTKKNFSVIKIECIQNPFLFSSYLFKKEELKSRFYNQTQEKLLFHGTKKANLDNICKNNFDWRMHGKALGHRFGRGVSFSPISNYASHYCDKAENVKVMIVAKVLISKSCTGNGSMDIPPDGYDTSQKEDGHVVVKYSDDEFYPAYKIYFSIGVYNIDA